MGRLFSRAVRRFFDGEPDIMPRIDVRSDSWDGESSLRICTADGALDWSLVCCSAKR
jgi:hypothetical protein